jgi:hypothetical protein
MALLKRSTVLINLIVMRIKHWFEHGAMMGGQTIQLVANQMFYVWHIYVEYFRNRSFWSNDITCLCAATKLFKSKK